ncbi:MAG: glycosyltransferase family 4 protein [Acutalibacteraceae bacterium]
MYAPDDFKINDVVAQLVKQGHMVKVVTGLPDYATSRIPKDYRWFRRRHEKSEGLEIRRLPIIARRSGVFFRMLNYASYVLSGLIYTLFAPKKGVDAVLVYETSPVFQALPALLYAKLARRPVTLYCLDVWPACVKAWNVGENALFYRFSLRMSRFIYRRCETVAVSSRPFIPYLRDVCGVEEKKMPYLPQHAEDLYEKAGGGYEENGVTDFLFAGNIGAVQDVQTIIRAAALIPPDKPFAVHIVGSGSEQEHCQQLADQLGLADKVIFHGRYPKSDMPRFYRLADALLLTLRGGDIIGQTLPAKAQSYLSCGKPILGAIDGAGQEMIRQADCGACVSAGDAKGLAAAMERLIDDPAPYRKKGENGRRFYEENYTEDLFMRRLTALLSADAAK